MTTQPGLIIDGRELSTDARFEVRNPADGTVVGAAPDCSPQQLDQAVAAAGAAYRDWAGRDDRAAHLNAAAKVVVDNAEQLAALLTAEQGKPLREALAEVHGVAGWLRWYAAVDLASEVVHETADTRVEVHYRPLGVVAAVTPWNFPLLLAAWKLAPALRTGNTVVLKPSPYTPLSSLLLGALLQQVLPAGVLNVVTGQDPLGGVLTGHAGIQKISFTGSVATGRKVARFAADGLKRSTLELGGNDAAIVLDDADPETVATGLFRAAFANAGQVCSAVKRVYVPAALHDQLVEALAAAASHVVLGPGDRPDTTMGPVNNAPQLTRVSSLVEQARADGATVVVGGASPDGPGLFYAPTIVTDAQDGMALVDEEQFGPALPIIRYRTEAAAVASANGTHFGLSGSVWSADPDRAAAVATQLECGTAWVNTHLALAPYQPFGGAKWSGVGVENGHWGLRSYTEPRVLHRPVTVQGTA